MAETYSLTLTGTSADFLPIEKSVLLPDRLNSTPAKHQVARTGEALACVTPRGTTHFYVYDAERSTAALPVMRKLYG